MGITTSNCTVTSPPSTKSPQYDYHFRYLHHRLGSLFGGYNYRGDKVSTGNDALHQLFETSSRLPASTMFSEDREQYDHSSKVGQRDGTHLHQPDGRNSLQALYQLALAFWKWCIQRNLFENIFQASKMNWQTKNPGTGRIDATR